LLDRRKDGGFITTTDPSIAAANPVDVPLMSYTRVTAVGNEVDIASSEAAVSAISH
jgi:hypothetical protein